MLQDLTKEYGSDQDRFQERGIRDIYSAVRWNSGDLLVFLKEIGFTLSNFINLKAKLE